MRGLRGQLALTVACFLLGLLLVMQFRTQERIAADLRAQSGQNQLTLLGSLIESNARLRDEAARLDAQLAGTARASAPDAAGMADELAQLRLINGQVEARGAGVRATLDAALDTYWLQDVLNELRNAGALALSVNGRRILPASVLSGTAGQIALDGQPLPRPYRIEAVGEPETLAAALNRPGGILLQLRAQYGPGAAALARPPDLLLPPHPTGASLRVARPPAP